MTETKKRERRENLKSFLKNEAQYIEHDYGVELQKKSEYHYRLHNHQNGKVVDIYPSTKKFMYGKISKNVAYYNDLEKVIKHHL